MKIAAFQSFEICTAGAEFLEQGPSLLKDPVETGEVRRLSRRDRRVTASRQPLGCAAVPASKSGSRLVPTSAAASSSDAVSVSDAD